MAASTASEIAALIAAASGGVRAARNAHEPPELEADDDFQSLLDTTRHAFRRAKSPRLAPGQCCVEYINTNKCSAIV